MYVIIRVACLISARFRLPSQYQNRHDDDDDEKNDHGHYSSRYDSHLHIVILSDVIWR